jgi:hypothetical protein
MWQHGFQLLTVTGKLWKAEWGWTNKIYRITIFVSLSRICLKYLLFWRYVTINQSRQTNIRSVQTSIRRKERNALMLMLWKRQCVPKHTSTLEYHVSDASLLIYKSIYMCNPKLLFNDIWSWFVAID